MLLTCPGTYYNIGREAKKGSREETNRRKKNSSEQRVDLQILYHTILTYSMGYIIYVVTCTNNS